jgi:NH3-dependent NAD+ synthetase
MSKLQARVDMLYEKIKKSQTPVPGFIIGLSGTDSIAAFIIAYRAMRMVSKEHASRVLGIHYVNAKRKAGSFESIAIPWLKRQCGLAQVEVRTPLGINTDQQRWADLHLRALHKVETDSTGTLIVIRREHGKTFWIVGTINATERALGKYSLISDSASIQLLHTCYKSDVMKMCEELEVPERIMENARLPDCACGREEVAAENIELIDDLLRHRGNLKDFPDKDLLQQCWQYIQECKEDYGHKVRIPYQL